MKGPSGKWCSFIQNRKIPWMTNERSQTHNKKRRVGIEKLISWVNRVCVQVGETRLYSAAYSASTLFHQPVWEWSLNDSQNRSDNHHPRWGVNCCLYKSIRSQRKVGGCSQSIVWTHQIQNICPLRQLLYKVTAGTENNRNQDRVETIPEFDSDLWPPR